MKVGDAAIGNAGGKGGELAAPGNVSGGISRSLPDESGSNAQTLTDMIQVDANAAGRLRGPLVDAKAKVSGSTPPHHPRAAHRTADHEIRHTDQPGTEHRRHRGQPQRAEWVGNLAHDGGYLGVQVDLDHSVVAAVVGVQSNSPAKSAGLKAGDVITAVDKTEITSADELTSTMHGAGGDSVQIAGTPAMGRAIATRRWHRGNRSRYRRPSAPLLSAS
jgi:S1-C subfamily serine protease